MRDVTYSMSMSADGYIYESDGTFDWSVPDPEVFALATDEVRGAGFHLMGRKLYETMLYWEPEFAPAELDEAELKFAELWRALPKVVFSTTLTEVQGNARLAEGTVAEEIERLRAEPGDGVIAIGGATLADSVAAAGLIDEYRIRTYPVLVGGGRPFFAHDERKVGLELLEARPVGVGVMYSRFRVKR